MQICHPVEEANLLQSVRSVILDQVGVRVVKLNILHVADVVHDLEFLHQVFLHTLFDHIATCEESPDASLKDEDVFLNHQENISVDLHPEERLNCGRSHVEAVDLASDYQTSQTLLDLLGRNMES